MEINWFGDKFLKIKTKSGIILCDPQSIDDKKIKLKADVITFSHPEYQKDIFEKIEGNLRDKPFIFDLPGEYEVSGINIFGLALVSHGSGKRSTVFTYSVEDMKLGHLGNPVESLSDKQLDLIGGIDILFISIDGEEQLGVKKAVEIISQIDPKIVIPMNYQDLSSALDEFAKEEGISTKSKLEVFKVAKKDLPKDERETVLLANLSR